MMSNQGILTKAIEKAIAGGWKNEEMYSFDTRVGDGLFNPGIGEYGGHEDVNVLIYNHDFAKALWGKDAIGDAPYWSGHTPWKHHLQQMVIADDPIKYLGENI